MLGVFDNYCRQNGVVLLPWNHYRALAWYYPSKHAGSNPEAFWLRPVMAIMASVQPESGRSISRIRLPASVSAPFFQRRRGSHCAKSTRIRSGWPGQGLATRIWSGSKLCRNHRARFLARRNQPATSFPLSDSVPLFHRRP